MAHFRAETDQELTWILHPLNLASAEAGLVDGLADGVDRGRGDDRDLQQRPPCEIDPVPRPAVDDQ